MARTRKGWYIKYRGGSVVGRLLKFGINQIGLGKQRRKRKSRYIGHQCSGHLFSLKTKAAGHRVIPWVANKIVTKYLQ